MKFPKLWDGPNPVGEALNRALQRTGAPYQRASTAFGDTASSQGSYNEVRGGTEEGIYCLGIEADSGGQYVIRGADAWSTPFLKKGLWDGSAFSLANLNYVGSGKAVVPRVVSPTVDQLYTTRRGKLFRQSVAFSYSTDTYAYSRWSLMRAGRLADEEGRWVFGNTHYSVPTADTSDYAVVLWTVDTGETWRSMSATYGPGWRHGLGKFHALSPGVALLSVPTYVTVAGGRYAANANAGLSFMMAVDLVEGVMAETDPGALFALSFPADPVPVRNAVNSDMFAALHGTALCRLVDGAGVAALAHGWFYDREYSGSSVTPGSIAFKNDVAVFLGGMGGGFARLGSIRFPWEVAPPVDRFFLLGDRPVAQIRPVAASPSSFGQMALLVGTPDGLEWDIRPLPVPANRCGIVQAMDAETLVASAYVEEEGAFAYRLIVSKDAGLTWENSTVISRKGVAPAEPAAGEAVIMSNFSVVSYLRKGRLAAPLMPGAPWVGDDRKPKPWEA